jgi:hypothetical protein
MNAVSAPATIVASLVFWTGIAVATTNIAVTATVNSRSGPWDYVNGGLNTGYQYGVGDQTAPTMISAANGFGFSAGDSLTIQYVSGTVAAGSPGYPFVDALGETDTPLNNSVDLFHGAGPSYYMNPATYPIYLVELVGTFAASNGAIMGTPFAIGNSRTVTVPGGATQLQLGVNDNLYSDNFGSWTIQITGPAAISEPSTCASVPAVASGGVLFGTVVGGQTYTYSASGCAKWGNFADEFSDPDGNIYSASGCATFVHGPTAGTANFQCPRLGWASLVGRINGGPCMQLGSSGSFVAATSGALRLYLNDDNYADNGGSWDVCVGVLPEVILLTCPSNITVSTDSGQCSAVVTYPAPIVTPTNATVVCHPPSGATFPEGATTVGCVATGASGNSNTCSFSVTVLDGEAPRVACRPAPNPSGKISAPGKNGSNGVNPDGYYQLLAKDNCDPNPAIYVKDTGSTFVAGPFKDGDIMRVKHTGGAASSSPGTPPVVAVINLNGNGLAIAVDADGNVTTEANGCPLLVSLNQ